MDGACGVLRAANDLGLNTINFTRAFSAVGIDLVFCSLDGTVDHIFCKCFLRLLELSLV